MYLNSNFEVLDIPELHQCIRDYPLATVILQGHDELEINHIPLELESNKASLGVLKGHIAKQNPMFSLLQENLEIPVYLVFHAEQQYISPNWYVGKQEHHRVVPTWNYRVVHVKGQIKLMNDERFLRGVLARLTRIHENNQEQPWKMSDAPVDFIQDQLKKITGFEIGITSMVGKYKVSQNRTKEDAVNIAAQLQIQNSDMAKAVEQYAIKNRNQ